MQEKYMKMAIELAGKALKEDEVPIGSVIVKNNKIISKAYKTKEKKFVVAYTYSTATSTKCITGDESTCVKTTCYKTTGKSSCPVGTIIKYRVKDFEIVTFHVVRDEFYGLVMQTQKNTVYNVAWNGNSSASISDGPVTVLSAIENETASWSNVNSQTYTAGTTKFIANPLEGSSASAYTMCTSSNDINTCTTNSYTLSSRTAKARLLTVQEAITAGYTSHAPTWMMGDNAEYWLMTTGSNSPYHMSSGYIVAYASITSKLNARAVVYVTKGDY